MQTPIHERFLIRPITVNDVVNLAQIRVTFRTDTILDVRKSGSGLAVGWTITEVQQPFDRGTQYNFSQNTLQQIKLRLAQPKNALLRVAVERANPDRLVGFVDVEIHHWNSSAFLWNLMIDQDFRRQGLGTALWEHAITFAQRSRARAILVETQNTNVHACKFYAHLGCELVGIHEAQYTNQNKPNREIALFWSYPLL